MFGNNKTSYTNLNVSNFKDSSQYPILRDKIIRDLRNSLQNTPNWEFQITKDGFDIYDVNKPKGVFNYLMSNLTELNQFSKKPHMEVSISIELSKDDKLIQGINVIEGGVLKKHTQKVDILGPLTKMISFNDKVGSLVQDIQFVISGIVLKSIEEFERNRVTLNTQNTNELLNSIKQLELNVDIKSNLINNQKTFTDEHIPKLLKVISFYEDNLRNYSNLFSMIKEDQFVHKNQEEVNQTLQMIPFMYQSVLIIEKYLVEMINTYIEGDKITYFTIYNIFEEEGLFLSKGEKVMIENMEKMINEINKVNSSIESLITLTISIGEKISNQLSSINNKLMLNNILTGINTFQLNSIRNKLGK